MECANVSLRWVLQPIIDTQQPSRVCAEALIRGSDHYGNIVRPDLLIASAERSIEIFLLDQWMNLNVLNWLDDHKQKLHHIGFISVNLSAKTLSSHHYMGLIERDLALFPREVKSRICYEITETLPIDCIDHARRSVLKLQSHGALTALDDYGCGYAGIESLRALPVDLVKVSRRLPQQRDMETGQHLSLADVIRTIKKHTSTCVMEYVESEEDVALACSLGVRYLQGFGISAPITPEEFLRATSPNLKRRGHEIASLVRR